MNIEEYEVGENRIQLNKHFRRLQLLTDYHVEGVICIEIIQS